MTTFGLIKDPHTYFFRKNKFSWVWKLKKLFFWARKLVFLSFKTHGNLKKTCGFLYEPKSGHFAHCGKKQRIWWERKLSKINHLKCSTANEEVFGKKGMYAIFFSLSTLVSAKALTDIVTENVHILGEPISPTQLTQKYFWKVYPPCKSFKSD